MSGPSRWYQWPKRAIRKGLSPVVGLFARSGARNPRVARIYYGVFRSAFGREQMSFLAGQAAYRRALTAPTGSMAILRRNVHRIEKGLLMRPRRIPFALDYIGETVDAYVVACRAGEAVSPEERNWSSDVLEEYFRVHGDHPAVAGYRKDFLAAHSPRECGADGALIPYRRDLSVPPRVSVDDLHALSMRRRSVRWFLQEPVDRSLVDRAVEIGGLAPSACNRQPFQFRILDDPEMVRKAVSIPFGLGGYGHNVPVIAVVIGRQSNYFDERDRHLIYIDASLAIMGFLLALETQGLSSCCVNWPDVEHNERKMASLLRLEPYERPVMLIAIGRPDPEGMVARSTKKPLSELRRWNFE